MTNNERALLDVIAYAEGTIGLSNNGYDITFGHWVIQGWSENTDINHKGADWAQPFGKTTSNAAGRYQFLQSSWMGNWTGGDKTKEGQNVAMTKSNQDIAALYQIKTKRKVTDDEISGLEDLSTFTTVINKLAPEWASLPTLDGTGYYSDQGGDHSQEELLGIFNIALERYKKIKGRDAGSAFGA